MDIPRETERGTNSIGSYEHLIYYIENGLFDWPHFDNDSKVQKNRSSLSQMFFKIGILKNFTTFNGKLQQDREFNTPTQVFSCEHCQIFKNSFFIQYLRWLLLKEAAGKGSVPYISFLAVCPTYPIAAI